MGAPHPPTKRVSPRGGGKTPIRLTPRTATSHRRTLSLPTNSESPKGTNSRLRGSAVLKRNHYSFPIKSFSHSTHVGYTPSNPHKVNQDNFIETVGFAGHPGTFLFGVCDGHGTFGKEVSMYIKQRLPVLLGMDPALISTPKNSFTYAIVQVNEELTKSSLDVAFSGSTLVTVLLHGHKLWCANVGDSRAILARLSAEDSSAWTAIPLSRDHKPDDEDEGKRILSSGGRIAAYQDEAGQPLGPARVWLRDQDIPGLAMSRSLGDMVAASVGVICIPEILEMDLRSDDKFIIIGSDGLYEFMSNADAVRLVVPFWEKNDLHGACAALVAEARARWMAQEEVIDDVTCVVIFLEVP